MPPRRHRQPADRDVSAKALTAMAEAARRARAADGGAPAPPTAAPRRRPDPQAVERDPRSHVTETDRPVTAHVPAAPPEKARPAPDPPPPAADPPPPSRPGAPVLVFDALAEEDDATRAGPTSTVTSPPGPPADEVIAAAPTTRHRHSARPAPDGERRLRRAVGIVSAAVVLMVAALVGSELAGGGAPPSVPGARHASARATLPSTTVPVTSSPSTTTEVPAAVPAPSSTTTTTTAPSPLPTATPGGAPVLTTLQPSTGTAGQSVVVLGSGFLSPSGHIGASVDGQTASVSCPDQTTCTVTIPPQIPAGTAVPVVITTDGGLSNPLTFTVA